MKLFLITVALMASVIAANARRYNSGLSYQHTGFNMNSNSHGMSYGNSHGMSHSHSYYQQSQGSDEMQEMYQAFSGLSSEGVGLYFSAQKMRGHMNHFTWALQQLGKKLLSIYQKEWMAEKQQFIKLIETIPAETIKESALLVMRKGKEANIAVMHTLKEKNPLKPHYKAPTSTSSFAGTIADMIFKSNKVITKFFEIVDSKLVEIYTKNVDESIKSLEKMNADVLKQSIIGGLRRM